VNRTWIKLSVALLALVFLAGCRTYPDEVGSLRFPILAAIYSVGRTPSSGSNATSVTRLMVLN